MPAQWWFLRKKTDGVCIHLDLEVPQLSQFQQLFCNSVSWFVNGDMLIFRKFWKQCPFGLHRGAVSAGANLRPTGRRRRARASRRFEPATRPGQRVARRLLWGRLLGRPARLSASGHALEQGYFEPFCCGTSTEIVVLYLFYLFILQYSACSSFEVVFPIAPSSWNLLFTISLSWKHKHWRKIALYCKSFNLLMPWSNGFWMNFYLFLQYYQS